MKGETLLRTGLPEDSGDFAALISLSATSVLPAFGTRSVEFLTSLFRQKRNLFSFEHTHFIEVDSRNAAMILSYSGEVQREQRVKTGLLLFKGMKWTLITQLPALLRISSLFDKIKKDEYYISNIAVYPEYRGLSLASRLLAQVENQGKVAGVRNMVLDVEIKSHEAIKLYAKSGYIRIGKAHQVTIGGQSGTYFRLSKKIA